MGPLAAAALAALLASPPEPLPVVVVDRDDLEIRTSCRLRFLAPVADAAGDGVVRITGDGIVVDLDGGTLFGALPDAAPESLAGFGIVVTGKGVTVRNGAIRGFRCGIVATGSDGSTFESLDLSDNFAMRLRSTPAAEATADWLWPHENEEREWVTRYGAGLLVEDSREVTVREVKVRRTQNGILFHRTNASKVYDNDCSFLSGWGLALYRSSDNVIGRNAFDFCVRGYSHGVYNRGQDSAGILLFEQSERNLIALNSATHGGDGFFGFAGRDALGERPPREPFPDDAARDAYHRGRGANGNRLIANDFSYAAAHGIEMTFSTGNVFAGNRCVGNGICGVWGGYSRSTLIRGNEFADNGAGGIDIEHGVGNVILGNSFRREGVAIELWDDVDEAILKTPWAKANRVDPGDTLILDNRFEECRTPIELRGTDRDTIAGNVATGAETAVRLRDARRVTLAGNEFGGAPVANEGSDLVDGPVPALDLEPVPTAEELAATLPGRTNPVGARRHLRGRERIVMLPYGPYDWASPALVPLREEPHRHAWLGLGLGELKGVDVYGSGPLRVLADLPKAQATVLAERSGFVLPYRVRFRHADGRAEARGTLTAADWEVRFFPLVTDPRDDPEGWRTASTGPDSVQIEAPAIDFTFGNGGPASLAPTPLAAETLAGSDLPVDRFGTAAKATLRFPAGTWRIHVESDDGVRVRADGATILDDWTWHPPRIGVATLELAEDREVTLEVDHFELDGYSVLRLWIDGEPLKKP